MAGHEWQDWFEREEFIGQISDIRVQNLQVEREMVQKRTFTRWINLHLLKCDPPIEVHDLFQDIQDGHILMALLEELSGCKLLHGFKKSTHRIFRLNNIAKVLTFLEERNVKLVSIDAADVADGNPSIILGLIWNIILFFQIKELTGNIRSQFPSTSSLSSIPTSSDSDTSHSSTPSDERQSASTAMREHGKAIKKLLQWVQKRTRKYGVAVQDFGKSWTSGLAFLAVIKSVDTSLVDMRKALLRSARENLEDAFRIAHYSLGIPRLLEPEDVTMNAPDEQSIMMYVSQFLEHFPGIEEPEESYQLIEQSISMGRLNFHDGDLDHMRNSAHRGRVKERSYIFQRDCVKPPPKILISSVSEDRSVISPSYRRAAARSWSSEDILVDSCLGKDPSGREPANGASTNAASDSSPQLSYAHSPTSSSMPESVIGDSAISSPDSWVESEFAVTPEKLYESQSDGSLCDSGMAWDVYRATPVEVTAVDEGFIPSVDDRAPEDSYVDEGIYSLTSIESSQLHTEKKQVETNLGNQEMAVEQVPDQRMTAMTKEVDSSEQGEAKELRKHVEQEASFGVSGAETSLLLKDDELNHCELSTDTGHSYPKNDSVEGNKGEESRDELGISKETDDETVEKENKPSEEPLGACTEFQENDNPETSVSENTQSSNQEGAPKKAPDSSVCMNIPLISISSEPEEQDEKEMCDPERQDHCNDDDVGQRKVPESEGTRPDVNSSQSPDKMTCISTEEDVEVPAEIPQHVGPCLSEQTRGSGKEHLDDTEKSNTDISPNVDKCGTDTIENLEDQLSQGLITETQLVDTETLRDHGLVLTQHDSSHWASSLASSNPSVKTELSSGDSPKTSTNMDLFYEDFDRGSPTEDIVGDPVEPMDLFYPDKEEPMFTEPLDTEMQSWPSVLSVTALQPAPPSDILPDNQNQDLLSLDLRNRVGFSQEHNEVLTKTIQETNGAESQEPCLLAGEKAGGPLGSDAPVNGSVLSEAEPLKPVTSRENTPPVRNDTESWSRRDENQIPPVLRHRKGIRLTESTDGQKSASGKVNNDDSVWWEETWELPVLLLLWLLLYCLWVLPQMDLKTLPGTLLNLNR
ncbi:uncharacterized protein clmna isoform 2-T2 [Pholidichthys leucotaenia]